MTGPNPIEQNGPAIIKILDQRAKLEKELQARRFDFSAEPPPENIVLKIEGKNIGALQNIVTITGLPKQGKSKFTAGMAAAAISGRKIFGIECNPPADRPGVGYWTTDESANDFFKTITLIKDLAGGITEHFHPFNVRRDEPRQIIPLLKFYLETHPQTSVLFLDNIGDLLLNYNDEGQSKRVINFLKNWSDIHNILLIGTLHLGKGNMTSLGHLGAGLDRYSQSVFKVEKDQERQNYTMSAAVLRSAGDFNPLCIYYDNGANSWRQTDYLEEPQKVGKQPKEKPQDLDKQDHRRAVGQIFNSQPYLNYGQLIEAIRANYAQGRNWAVSCIQFLIREGLVFNPVPGQYTNRKQTEMKLYVEE